MTIFSIGNHIWKRGDKMTNTKETLEGLKSLFKGNKVEYSTAEEYQKEQVTLSTAISWGEILEQAEGELPEKTYDYFGTTYKRVTEAKMCQEKENSRNQIIDIARPILAKAKLRIALIEQANKAANKVIEEEINLKTEALSRISELEQKLIDKNPKL